MNKHFLVNLAVAALPLAASVADSGPEPLRRPQHLNLADGWLLQSSAVVTNSGAELSRTRYEPQRWYRVTVPSTVLSALIKNQVYPDLRVGLNAYRIPDSSDEFNAAHDLARFSHLPGQRNPWRDPWWSRTEFILPTLRADRHVWLHFDAINYRAAVWLNRVLIADTNVMAGMFQRFQFDITDAIRPGANALAVQTCPVDHPGTPDTMWEPLGKERAPIERAHLVGQHHALHAQPRRQRGFERVAFRPVGHGAEHRQSHEPVVSRGRQDERRPPPSLLAPRLRIEANPNQVAAFGGLQGNFSRPTDRPQSVSGSRPTPRGQTGNRGTKPLPGASRSSAPGLSDVGFAPGAPPGWLVRRLDGRLVSPFAGKCERR